MNPAPKRACTDMERALTDAEVQERLTLLQGAAELAARTGHYKVRIYIGNILPQEALDKWRDVSIPAIFEGATRKGDGSFVFKQQMTCSAADQLLEAVVLHFNSEIGDEVSWELSKIDPKAFERL